MHRHIRDIYARATGIGWPLFKETADGSAYDRCGAFS